MFLTSLLVAGLSLIGDAKVELVDLTHDFDEQTLYWPTSPSGFTLQVLSYGKSQGGWFYSANAFCAPEHGGTHLDAPLHFDQDGDDAAKVPLSKLMAPVALIDVSLHFRCIAWSAPTMCLPSRI